jgi:hypothetical protein
VNPTCAARIRPSEQPPLTVGAAGAGIGSNPALAAALVLSVAGIVAQFSFWIATRR